MLAKFEKSIGVEFKNQALLREAFTHRSYLNENREATTDHNERLEFLGDAVLELVVTDFLYQKYLKKPEGELTAIRAALVNTVSIQDAATKIGINDYLLLSRGEARDTGRARGIILANAFEALIGAIYLDRGYDASRDFIANNLFDKTDEIVEKRLWQDAKSRFQEIAQEKDGRTPSYKLLSHTGPDHARTFSVGVFIGDDRIASGDGKSKQEAEQAAALKALEVKGW